MNGVITFTDILNSIFSSYFVWFIPADENELFISPVTLPKGIIVTGIFGPFPERSLIPSAFPTGIPRTEESYSFNARYTSSVRTLRIMLSRSVSTVI